MTLLTGLMLLAAASLALWIALAAFAVGRKLRRDRRELRSGERRARYSATLRDGDRAALVEIHREARSAEAQVDLAIAIDAVRPSLPPAQRSELGRAAQESGLLPVLVAELGSRRPVVRARGALVLTRTGLPEVIDQIAPLFADNDADVRLVACSGLARVGTDRAAEALIWGLVTRALPPERIIERLAAPWAVPTMLMTLELGPSPVPPSLAAVTPRGRAVPLEASLARALGLAEDQRGEAALIALLRDGSEEVQVSAARALGRVGGAASVPSLIAALDSEIWPVRAQAAKSLGSLGAIAAIEPLERCLPDRAWWVRGNSARALRELGEPGIEALERALDHPDRYARDRAREQLVLQRVIEEHATA
jgi:HEAT repeat protein